MAGTVPQQSESETLTNLIAQWLGQMECALYASDVAIGPNTILTSLTSAEASFAGYGRVGLTSWSTPTIDGTGAAITTCTQATFTPSAAGGSGNLFGYFLVNSLNQIWAGVERFAGAPLTVAQGITLEVDITYSVITRY